MAVRPWLGQIAEPATHNEIDPSKPDAQYALEYVYGYRCADSRQNVYWNSEGQAAYMTAALGVILDVPSNTQKFFGGGEVENTSKHVANDENGHTNDILAISICNQRKMCVSGQVGSRPVAFTWDAITGEKLNRFKLPKGCRGINACGISEDHSMIAVVDLHNEHQVHVFNTESGSLVFKKKGDTNKIHDLAWSQQPGSSVFATAGTKHIYFWDAKTGEKKKGIFGGNPMCSQSSVTFDADGTCYTGGANS